MIKMKSVYKLGLINLLMIIVSSNKKIKHMEKNYNYNKAIKRLKYIIYDFVKNKELMYHFASLLLNLKALYK